MQMNDNQIYLSYMPEDDDTPIDLKDILAGLLLRWKPLLASILIFAILCTGVSFLRAKESRSIEDRLLAARAKLSEASAADLESLHERMLAYQTYQTHLEEDYARYVTNAANAEDYTLLNASYYLSTSVDHLDELLPAILFTEEDYDAMRSVISEEASLSTVYDRVSVVSSANITTGQSEGTIVNVMPEEGTARTSNYLFLVSLYGSSETECAALLEIVDAAMARSIESFRSLDPGVTLVTVEKNYSGNTRDYIQQQITNNMLILNNIETQRNNANNNRITKLTGDEKSYYELLVESETAEFGAVSKKKVSWKKWLVLGAAAGAFLYLLLYLLRYIFDGTVKISAEAEGLFRKKNLQKIYLPGNKNLFGKCADALVGKDTVSPEEKAELIAADLQILMSKSGASHLYLLRSRMDPDTESFVSLVQERILKAVPGSVVSSGDPTSSISDLEAFSEAELAVPFIELKHSRRKTLAQWEDFCKRHHLPVAGIVTVEKCW